MKLALLTYIVYFFAGKPWSTIALQSVVSAKLNTRVVLQCSFSNKHAIENKNAWFDWNIGGDRWLNLRNNGTVLIEVTSWCNTQYWCRPKNAAGYGEPQSFRLDIIGKYFLLIVMYSSEQMQLNIPSWQ